MTDTPTAKRVEVTETGRVYIDRKPLPFKTGAVSATTKANGNVSTITIAVPVDGEVVFGGADAVDVPKLGRPREAVVVLAANESDGAQFADAVGLTGQDYTVLTPTTAARHRGLIIRAVLVSPYFRFHIESGDRDAHTAYRNVRRDAARAGVRL